MTATLKSGLDDFRRNQLRRTDLHSLRACVAWGRINQPHSEETAFAIGLLRERIAA